jgi:outer membrane protein assembly factor BamB
MMILRSGSRSKRARRRGSRLAWALAGAAGCACVLLDAAPLPPSWGQWGRDPQHTGASPASAQPLAAILADEVYDPFVDAEKAEADGDLLVHYAAPLVDGDDVYVEFKSGRFVPCVPPGSNEPAPCGLDRLDTQVWGVRKLTWLSGGLVRQWEFASDWRPEPNLFFEPVFQPALANGFLYVPGLGGTVHKVATDTGAAVARLNPFSSIDPSRYVAGGLAVAPDGAVVYDALALSASGQWTADAAGAWLVRIAPDDTTGRADFASLVTGAPQPLAACRQSFSVNQLPWPPSPGAVPTFAPCGSQRPGLNVVPAIAPDGTIYVVSRAHFNDRYAYLVAVHADLTPSWSASLRGILNDGCDVLLPASGTPGGCASGATRGVDPATNENPAGRVSDSSTSSPVVLPDGSVLYGAYTRFNYSRGHLFRFDARGQVLATSDFGWDITPAVRRHGDAFSIVLKDNHYPAGSYCDDLDFCAAQTARYDLSSLDPGLEREWTFTNTTAQACAREPDGTVVCEPVDEPGFEWCVNQPAVDADGVTYVNSEDGSLYAIGPDGTLRASLFLRLALGAAYTPVSIGPEGRIYAQNNGHLLVVGFPVAPRDAPASAQPQRPVTREIARP